MKKLIRFFSVKVLSLALINTSFSAISSESISAEAYLVMKDTINAKDFWTKIVDAKHSGYDAKKVKELGDFIKLHWEIKNYKLPKVSIENNKLAFVLEEKTYFITAFKTGVLTLESGNKKAILNSTMTLDQIKQIITDTFSVNTVSLFSFLVQDASAFADLLIIALLLTALAVVVLLIQFAMFNISDTYERMVAAVNDLEKACDRVQNTLLQTENIELLKTHYNTLNGYFSKHCIIEPRESDCKKIVKVKQCFKAKINNKEEKAVDNTSRGANNKSLIYDIINDSYKAKNQQK